MERGNTDNTYVTPWRYMESCGAEIMVLALKNTFHRIPDFSSNIKLWNIHIFVSVQVLLFYYK